MLKNRTVLQRFFVSLLAFLLIFSSNVQAEDSEITFEWNYYEPMDIFYISISHYNQQGTYTYWFDTSAGGYIYSHSNLESDGATTLGLRCSGVIRLRVGTGPGTSQEITISTHVQSDEEYCSQGDEPQDAPQFDGNDSINSDGSTSGSYTSGGGSGTSGDGTDGGDGTGSGGSGTSGDGEHCSGCEVFSCPAWDQYMGKLDEIKNQIPPAPNWQQVANTFRDTIVPKMIADMENMLGYAPTKPSPPPELPDLDTGGIESQRPDFIENTELQESNFTKDDIQNEAEEIPFREDETGGFDIKNPIDSLPDLPMEDFPKPGETDPGEWGENKPKEEQFEAPIPEEKPTPEFEGPKPSDNSDQPPNPSDGGDSPPIPNEDNSDAPTPEQGYNPPNPDGVEFPFINYKKHPDDPDGSG